jgi:hypothetical protein
MTLRRWRHALSVGAQAGGLLSALCALVAL